MATDRWQPAETDERRRYERLGEALLTDNGRLTTAAQAKTVAIEVLAMRMRSSTLALAMAATGLIVGTDMPARLGDSRYVLVAHDERAPAAGADLLHVDELRSERYRPYAHRAVRMDTEPAERLVRLIATSELMSAWSYGSSNNVRTLALQDITRDEFGLRDVREQRMSGGTRADVDRDGIVSSPRAAEREQTAAAPGRATPPGSTLGAATTIPEPALETAPGWHPHAVAARLFAPDALDARIGRILDGAEEAPSWWLRDDSGYAVVRRDLEFLGIDPQHLRWMLTGQSPMGLTPRLYQQFAGEMLAALKDDRLQAGQVDIRLKGTAAGFFSGPRKTLPTEAELAGKPEAVDRMREWFGSDANRPLRRPYDAMYRLGLEPEPSDYDLDINSTAAVRAARAHWRESNRDRYAGDFMGGHGYLDKQAVRGALPHLADWARRWEDRLGRPLSLGVFESAGPFDEAALGRKLSAHLQDSDWIIHRSQKVAGPNVPRAPGHPSARPWPVSGSRPRARDRADRVRL